MNEKLTQLTLTELVDKLSDCTAKFSKWPLDGSSPHHLLELRKIIEELQKEIAKRKAGNRQMAKGGGQ